MAAKRRIVKFTHDDQGLQVDGDELGCATVRDVSDPTFGQVCADREAPSVVQSVELNG